MMRQQCWNMLAGVMVVCGVSLALGCSAQPAGAQNPAPQPGTKATVKEATPAKTAAPAKKVAKKPAGRLPIYYADIVTEDQKAKIYAIQGTYADKLNALTEQIKAIQAQQSAEIEAVLSEEQQQKLKAAKDAAAAKREQRTAEAAKSEAPKKEVAE